MNGRVPLSEMVARGLRVMHGMLHVKRRGIFNADAQSHDSQAQGKNTRQSHSRQIPLNNELRVVRLLFEQRISF